MAWALNDALQPLLVPRKPSWSKLVPWQTALNERMPHRSSICDHLSGLWLRHVRLWNSRQLRLKHVLCVT